MKVIARRVSPVLPTRSTSLWRSLLLLPALLIPALLPAASDYTSPYDFTTFAGLSNTGTAVGQGLGAQFTRCAAVVVDASGNTYVADTGSNVIRVISSAGLVSALAGMDGISGTADGTGSAARFTSPGGIALGPDGNLYVSDTGNNSIRRVTPAGVVTTIAGSTAGESGSANGTGTAARFLDPTGIVATGSAGSVTVFVSDTGNNAIRRIDSSLAVTTYAGLALAPSTGSTDLQGTSARFYAPLSLAADAAGNLYIADTSNHIIRKIDTAFNVTTYAGQGGVRGSTNGAAAAALFNYPADVAVDATGNVYVADMSNHVIRKIDTALNVTTLAGLAGTAGGVDGTGDVARFNGPTAIVVDSSGNLFVADSGNHAIRKIASGGVVTTFAGALGMAGASNGTGNAATFSAPTGLEIDSSGNLYVGETGAYVIRKVTSSPVVTFLAGYPGTSGIDNGKGAAALFANPRSAAIDASGNLYVADTTKHTIRKVTSDGTVTTFAGRAGYRGTADGTGDAARFANPSGICFNAKDGALYVTDNSSNTIRKVTTAGVVTTVAGSPGSAGYVVSSGDASQWRSVARFNSPTGLALDPTTGALIVADSGNNAIRAIKADDFVATIAGNGNDSSNNTRDGLGITKDGEPGVARFNSPRGVAVDSAGVIYVADTENSTIRRIAKDAYRTVTTIVGRVGARGMVDGSAYTTTPAVGAPADGLARINNAWGIAVIPSGGLRIADTYNNAVRDVSPSGAVATVAGSGLAGSKGYADGSTATARFNAPTGIAVAADGTVYVSDTFNFTVRRIRTNGQVDTLAGKIGAAGRSNGTGAEASFTLPAGAAVDSNGNLFVADRYSHVIRKVTPGGVVTDFAGTPGKAGSTDGTGSGASFSGPAGVAIDRRDNTVYVADSASSTIRKITADGVVTTYAGSAAVAASTDGIATAARFQFPTAVAVDASGVVFVADSGNNLIRRIGTDTSHTVTTLAGSALNPGSRDGQGTAAWFNSTAGIAVDSLGNVFVADSGNSVIRRISPTGKVTTIGGVPGAIGGLNGTGSGATFNGPRALAVGPGDVLYVADTYNNVIRVGTPAAGGAPATLPAGEPINRSVAAQLTGVDFSGNGASASAGATAPSAGSGSGSDITLPGDGTGSGGAATTLVGYAVGIARDASGNLFVSDMAGNVVRRVTPAGAVSVFAGTAGAAGAVDGTSATFNQPGAIAVDSTGSLGVADTGNALVRRVTAAGVVTTLAGSTSSRGNADGTGTAASFNHPLGLAADATGGFYVADSFTHTVRRVTAAGAVTTVAGVAGSAGSSDGGAAVARFNGPSGAAVDAAGNVFVADTANHTIRRITASGSTGTLAGLAGVSGSSDGSGVFALFNQPAGVAVDSTGYIYVSDTGNSTIRRISPSGVVDTIAGVAGVSGLADGTGLAALFNQPRGILVEASGGLVVADTGNGAVRRISPNGTVSTVSLSAAPAVTQPIGDSGTSGSSGSSGGSSGGGAVDPALAGALGLLGLAQWLARRNGSRA